MFVFFFLNSHEASQRCLGINLKKKKKKERKREEKRKIGRADCYPLLLSSSPSRNWPVHDSIIAPAYGDYVFTRLRSFHPFRSFRFQQEAEAARSRPTHEWMTNECVSETCFDSGDNKDPLRRDGSAVTATIVSAPASYLPPARANILKIFNGPDTPIQETEARTKLQPNQSLLFDSLVSLFLLPSLLPPFFPPQNSSTTDSLSDRLQIF